MDDIRRVSKPISQKKQAGQSSEESIQEIFSPPKEKEEIVRHPQRRLFFNIAGAVVFLLLAGGGGYYLFQQDMLTGKEEKSSFPAAVQEEKTQENSFIQPGVFYGIASRDGRLYFAKIDEISGEYYRLSSVFYQDKSKTVGTSSSSIILVKFGTEEYQPEGSLLLPKGRVKEIFRLKGDSPILKAVEQYLEGGR